MRPEQAHEEAQVHAMRRSRKALKRWSQAAMKRWPQDPMTRWPQAALLLAAPAWLAACPTLCPAPPGPQASSAAVVQASPYVPPGPLPTARTYSDVVPAGAFLFFDNLEKGAGLWQLPDGPDAIAWRLLNAHTCGGEYTLHFGAERHAFFTTPAGDSVVTLIKPIDLTKAQRPVLKFDVRGDALPPSALSLQPELKTATGAWQALDRKLTGDNVFVRTVVIDLAAWKGEAVNLRFRATFTPTTGPTRGLYLDDVAVIEPTP